MKKWLISLASAVIALMASAQQNKDYFLLIGTYTDAGSEGIYVFRFHGESGSVSAVSKVVTSNPSFLAVSPDEKYVYAVNENADSTRFLRAGSVASFSFNKKDGTLQFLNTQLSGGAHPAYVAIDKTGKWVAAGNYTAGSLALLPVLANGRLDSATQIIQHYGHGVNPSRQRSPHVHSTIFSPDNKYLFAQDLGTDRISIYAFDAGTGKLSEQPVFEQTVKPGAGPRHIAFSPDGKFVYLVQEMSGEIAAYRFENGKTEWIQDISALPTGFKGSIGSADIHVSHDGKFLYVSNRGSSNTIGVFSINSSTGMLTAKDFTSTRGKTPRNFNLTPDGRFLLVANQESANVVIFLVDPKTGLLTDTGNRIPISKPVCLQWISTGSD